MRKVSEREENGQIIVDVIYTPVIPLEQIVMTIDTSSLGISEKEIADAFVGYELENEREFLREEEESFK